MELQSSQSQLNFTLKTTELGLFTSTNINTEKPTPEAKVIKGISVNMPLRNTKEANT